MVKKIKSRTQGNQPHGDNGNSAQFKLRKISGSAVSKWKPVPSSLQELVMSWLEDSILNTSGQRTQAEERTIKSIRKNVAKRLSLLKVPKDKWLDVKSLKNTKHTLESTKKQFDEAEAKLTSAIEMEMKEVQLLQDKVDKMKEVTNDWDEQLHPILRVPSI
ncbi:unnamed protein product [Lymnaea stagnalis]|uniref:Uncharacterized protein n=1 Tax=Lymnaea stagnalis TaxID=6523 RepID=A0AAV2HLC9_LYMST